MEFQLVIDGPPVPKGRPRTFIQGRKIITTTPPRTREWEERARELAVLAMRGRKPLEGPLKVLVVAHVKIPKGWSKKKKRAAESFELLPTTRPDADNYLKAALDICTGPPPKSLPLVFRDDSQVVDARVVKVYSFTPRVTITVLRSNLQQVLWKQRLEDAFGD